jgi:hypothetical protein
MKFTNLAKTELASQLLSSGNTFNVVAGKGAKFPAIGDTNLFTGIIWGSSFATPFDDPDYEIVVAYRSATDQITVARAQENTVAKQWEIGDNFMHTLTAGTFDRYETHELTAKTTVVDADEFRIWDSATNLFKKLSLANLKSTLKTYFDTLYPQQDGWIPASGTWSASDANTISIAGVDLTGVLQKGDKIKVTNNSGVKYYYISNVPVFATDTTFDVSGEVDLVAGAITLPFFSKIDSPQGFKKGEIYYKAKGVHSGSQTINNNTITKVTLTTEQFDVNGNFDTANSKYVAPIGGYYLVTAFLTDYLYNEITDQDVYIYKNGSNFESKGMSIPAKMTTPFAMISTELYLAKGDYIELFVRSVAAGGGTTTCNSAILTIQFISI